MMYFTEPAANKIALPTSSAGLIDIIAGPDGNLWFAENSANKIGKLAL